VYARPLRCDILEEIDVTVDDGTDEYEFEGLAPKGDRVLSSGRIGFGGS
jgi:hypothetical protein